jgi:hypothetical protein
MSPALGERCRPDGSAWTLEWVGDAWAPVCPTDDVPMTVHDGCGRLVCVVCERTALGTVREGT